MSLADYLRIKEGFGPYIGPCVDTDNYQVQGACSQLNTDSQNAKISKGEFAHKKKKSNRSLKEITEEAAVAPVSPPMSSQPAGVSMPKGTNDAQRKKWSASKKDIMDYWKTLEANKPIVAKPIQYGFKGSTYGEDGIRITGSPAFITTVISHLKDFMAYENPQTKLAVSYRETESPSKISTGQNKTSYVFYIAVKERGAKG